PTGRSGRLEHPSTLDHGCAEHLTSLVESRADLTSSVVIERSHLLLEPGELGSLADEVALESGQLIEGRCPCDLGGGLGLDAPDVVDHGPRTLPPGPALSPLGSPVRGPGAAHRQGWWMPRDACGSQPNLCHHAAHALSLGSAHRG